MLRPGAPSVYHVASHGLAIYDFGVNQMVGNPQHELFRAAAQPARCALARNHYRNAEDPGRRRRKTIHGSVEGVYQPEPMPADVFPQLPSAANRGKGLKRVNREVQNRNAFTGKLGAPKSFRTKNIRRAR